MSAQNRYVVYRPVESYVQRDSMRGEKERFDVSVIDRAELTKPNEITMSMANDKRRLDLVMQIEAKRTRILEVARENGEKIVTGGRLLATSAELPWFTKCAP